MSKSQDAMPGSRQQVVREHRTIHLLRYGQTLCRKPGVPATWEADHVWAGDADREHVNCPGCLAALLPNEATYKNLVIEAVQLAKNLSKQKSVRRSRRSRSERVSRTMIKQHLFA